MEKSKIVVPKGVRYLSEWPEFTLPDHPCIINKQITGCGFTELCLRNQENVVLCSPRKILLENKEDKHPEVLYVRNEFEKPTAVDKDLNSDREKSTNSSKTDDKLTTEEEKALYYANLKKQVFEYYLSCFNSGIPTKILVTYDSFRLIKEALGDAIKNFYVVIDEMQAVFTDARFKGDTELSFVSQVQDLQKVCYVSATPMIEKYLEMLDEFKDLPYYELDWKTADRHRVSRPELEVFGCSSIVSEALRIINEYKTGKFISTVFLNESGELESVESKEAVFYVNSVKNICDILKKANLSLSEVNILCANTPENKTRIRNAMGIKERGVKVFGKVPLEGEHHKMFTFCTRTVYLGADFCSTNARSFIFSDANIDCLSVDITLDLPQILGRQRLDCNPWKSRAELYFKSLKSVKEIDKMEELIEVKRQKTKDLLDGYLDARPEAKRAIAEKYQKDAKNSNYKDDYVAVNVHGGKDLIPECNMFVLAAEMRNIEIQRTDYKDRFSVFSAVEKENSIIGSDEVERALREFDKLTQFPDKMRLVCTTGFSSQLQKEFLRQVPTIFSDYYYLLGPEKCKAVSYRRSMMDEKLHPTEKPSLEDKSSQAISGDLIWSEFEVGRRYTKAAIKEKLRDIYCRAGYKATPKANNLSEYFELKRCSIPNQDTGKYDEGFEIMRKLL